MSILFDFGIMLLITILLFMVKSSLLKTQCEQRDGVTYVFGHGRQTLLNGINNKILCTFGGTIVFMGFGVIALTKSSLNSTILPLILFSFILSFFVFLNFSSIYAITEIKHIADGVMTNEKFFKLYSLIGVVYFICSNYVILYFISWKFIVGLMVFDCIIVTAQALTDN